MRFTQADQRPNETNEPEDRYHVQHHRCLQQNLRFPDRQNEAETSIPDVQNPVPESHQTTLTVPVKALTDINP